MECAVNEVATDLGCLPNDPVGFIQKTIDHHKL